MKEKAKKNNNYKVTRSYRSNLALIFAMNNIYTHTGLEIGFYLQFLLLWLLGNLELSLFPWYI